MVLVILPVLVLALYGAKFTGKGIRPDYISRESTQAVKGIFVLLVFLRHYKSCVSLTGAGSALSEAQQLAGAADRGAVLFLFRVRGLYVLSEKGCGLYKSHPEKAGADDSCPFRSGGVRLPAGGCPDGDPLQRGVDRLRFLCVAVGGEQQLVHLGDTGFVSDELGSAALSPSRGLAAGSPDGDEPSVCDPLPPGVSGFLVVVRHHLLLCGRDVVRAFP